MNIVMMALRNVGRNKRRTFLATLSVFIAILVVVFADGFISGIMDSMTHNVTKNQTGHVNIETQAYRERERFMPASAAITDTAPVMRALQAIPGLSDHISRIALRIQFGVVLSSGAQTKAARAIAGDPETERGLLMLDRTLLPGGSYCDQPGTAIVGEKLASDLGLKVGDTLKIVAEKSDYGLGMKKLRIVGLFRTGMDAFDRATFQLGLSDARDLLGLPGGASQILVMLKNYRESDDVARRIDAGLASAGLTGLSVKSWTSIGDTARLIAMVGNIYFWMEVVIAFLGAFIIANIMMMVVLERRHEIGVLKSMGMRPRTILNMFLTEGVLLGAIGSLVGAAAGTAINAYFGKRGLDLSNLIAGSNYQMDNVIHTGVHPLHVVAFLGLGIVVSAIVAFLPSRSAARMDPIEAIRSV
ncbi:MAG TPA: FtsX-like permease family protein [Rectinemataceae bacterium]|nr:FtsX-like permease family protein [Rectinemataceae bacterium]